MALWVIDGKRGGSFYISWGGREGLSVSSMLDYCWKAFCRENPVCSLLASVCITRWHSCFSLTLIYSALLHHRLCASPLTWDHHLCCFLCYFYYMCNHCLTCTIHVDGADCQHPYESHMSYSSLPNYRRDFTFQSICRVKHDGSRLKVPPQNACALLM